jgi:hypothetical protein
MITSGTYAFTVTRDDLIQAALRVCTAYGPLDTIPPQEIIYCAQALNILVKSAAFRALPLWCIQTVSTPLVQGVASYNLATIAAMQRPQKVINAWVRNATLQDTQLSPLARSDYEALGLKSSQGTPNQYYYDPQLSNATITVYNTPADNTNTLFVTIKRQLQDFNLSTDNPDFPQEAYQLLKWCLADEIALEYSTPADVRKEITAKAVAFFDSFMDSEQENASVMFTPSSQKHG